jgi:hypothetical protein
MPNLNAKEYASFESIKHIAENGSEFWNARPTEGRSLCWPFLELAGNMRAFLQDIGKKTRI